MRFNALVITAMAACFIQPGTADAKDLRNRFGVGFDSQITEVPALSVKYTFPASDKALNIAVQGLAGMSLPAQGSQRIMGGGRLLYAVVAEDQMNLYLGAGALYLSTESDDITFQGVRVQGLMGVEFFLYGLDNLGLSLQAGVNLDLGGSVPGVGTTASSLGGLGLHYYF